MANSNHSLEPEIEINLLKIKSLQLHNFRFFGDDENHNTFNFDSENTIIFGENGSGKSSIFKAFEFLAKDVIEESEFLDSKNIFTNSSTELSFELSNGDTTILDDDNFNMTEDYLTQFSILKPILDYKSLLKLNYRDIDFHKKSVNIYPVLKKLFKNYEIEGGKTLSSITNPDEYFEKLKEIVNSLLENIRYFIQKLSDEFNLEDFFFNKEFSENQNGTEFIVNIELSYRDKNIEKHHLFFNEARLSALAISIYFAIIKKFAELETGDSIRVLVLDDLLISLDMSNRMKLLKVLKEDFSDFQVIFLTHDRELFEVYKSSFKKKYEISLKSEDNLEKPFVKKHLNYFELAEKHFSEFDYPACANYLRKEVERLKEIKKKQEDSQNSEEVLFKKFKKLLDKEDLTDPEQHSRTVGKLIGLKKGFESETSSKVKIDYRYDFKSILSR
ncbi:hypothetical protein ThvES_00002770 [Thiovulum sp. ES]|nr:hypothetical protein ThvES_00002770 [Thiovulum sp. ES]